MKKLILGLALIASVIVSAQKEKGAYVSLNAGYGIGASNNSGETFARWGVVNNSQTSPANQIIELADVNLGKGLNFGATFGYMFNKFVGAELGVNYFLGGKSDARQSDLSGDFADTEVYAKMLQLKPTLVISGGFSKINPYAKFGLIIGAAANVTIENTGVTSTGTFASKQEFTGSSPIGFHGGAGLLYSLNNKISIFGELNVNNLNFSPKEAAITELTFNGVNLLPLSDKEDIEIEFVDSVDSAAISVPTAPRKEIKTTFNMSSLALNFGVRYSF